MTVFSFLVQTQVKSLLKENAEFKNTMFELFFLNEVKKNRKPHIGKILQFIRKHLVLGNIPIIYYARGSYRVEIIAKLYEKLVNELDNIDSICSSFVKKVQIVNNIQKAFRHANYQHNRLVYECLLWSLTILEKENIDLNEIEEEQLLQKIGQRIYNNLDKFTEIESHYYTKIVERFTYMSEIIRDLYGLKLDMYVCASNQATHKIKKLREHATSDTITKLGELESLRTIKPAPSRISICDLLTIMELRKFNIRPAYQREEVINISKASALIESILLEIHLPPIFIFKRMDNTLEIIDGQQRLLTILGYMGAKYLDENGNLQKPKNYNFALKGLNILDEFNRQKFKNLSTQWQDKFWDFKLSIVEIEECLNPEFDPVDLFVRLNYKPYPIEENSFEMWNSWADKYLIDTIKENCQKHRNWFFIRAYKKSDGSRMENEELYTSLAYLECKSNKYKDIWNYLYLCEQNDRISIRINQSKKITKLLELASQDKSEHQKFVASIKKVESFISKLKLVLLDMDIEDVQKKLVYFQSELNNIFKAHRNIRRYKRAKQDFYLLWYLLSPINREMVSYHRIQIKQEISDIFSTFRKLNPNNPQEITSERLKQIFSDFHQKYAQSKRKLNLTAAQKNEMILQQNNVDPISGASIFIGDEEVQSDHIKPIAIGGEDSIDNLQIAHKNSNLRKGAKFSG